MVRPDKHCQQIFFAIAKNTSTMPVVSNISSPMSNIIRVVVCNEIATHISRPPDAKRSSSNGL